MAHLQHARALLVSLVALLAPAAARAATGAPAIAAASACPREETPGGRREVRGEVNAAHQETRAEARALPARREVPAEVNATRQEARAEARALPARRGVRGEMNAAPLFATGVLASTALGVIAFMEFRWPTTSLAAEARALYALGDFFAGGASIHTALGSAVLTACWRDDPLFFCSVLEAGELRATAPVTEVVDVRAPWLVTAGPRIGAQWGLSPRFAIRAFAEPRATLARPSILVDDVRVWRARDLSLVLGVGFVFLLTPGGT